MADDDTPPGQRTLAAPDGCGFSEEAVLPIRINLMCEACKIPMFCTGPAMPSIIASNHQTGPVRPKFGHVCPSCKHTTKTDQPWPQIRYESHPHIALASPEEMARIQAENEALLAEAEAAERAETENNA